MLTQIRLKELFSYAPETGILTRILTINSKAKVGMTPGSISDDGYLKIIVDKKTYFAHRLVWLYVYGYFTKYPEFQIDHIDRDKLNNKIKNLRKVDQSKNQHNRINAQKNNKSTGLLGSYFEKRTGKYQSIIRVNGRAIGIGRFNTAEEAHIAYVDAKKIFHPSFNISKE